MLRPISLLSAIATLVFTTATSSTAIADEQSYWYSGIELSMLQQDNLRSVGRNVEENSNGGRISIGYQYNPTIGVEVGYNQLGDFAISTLGSQVATWSSYGADLLATASVELSENVSVYVKGGLLRWRGNVSGGNYSSGNSAKAGVGLLWLLPPNLQPNDLQLRFTGNYMYNDSIGDSSKIGETAIHQISLGLLFSY